MKNFVTGGTGFIGSFIAQRLIKNGETVRAFVRKSSDTKFLTSIGCEIYRGDMKDPDSIRAALKGMDRVFHSAAMTGDWLPRDEARRVNVEGTRHLLEAALQEKIKRFIYISSLAVLGVKDHNGTPESAPRIHANETYADSKIDSEELVERYGKERNLPFTIVRPGFVFGPRDPKLIPRMVQFLKNGRFSFIGSGDNKVNMVYIENLADVVMEASNSDKAINQLYNVTNDSGMSIKDVVYLISDVWNIKRPTKHIPKPIAYTACEILEFIARLTHAKKAPYINKMRIKFLSLNLNFDIGKTRDDLNYNPKIDMREGLLKTKAWMEEAGI